MKNFYEQLKPIVFGKIFSRQNANFNSHHHASVELRYILKGTTSYKYFDGNVEKRLLLEENNLCIIPSNLHHQESNPEECESLLLELEYQNSTSNFLTVLQEFAATNNIRIPASFLQNNEIIVYKNATTCEKTFAHLVELLYQNINNDVPLFYLRYEIGIKQLFVDINELPSTQPSFSKSNLYLNRAITFIQKNYGSDLSVADIALHVNVSDSYITKVFKRELDISPMAYLNRYRLNKAINLLKNSPLTISQISATVGYKTIRTFEIAFQNAYQISPQKYRKHLSVPSFTFETNYADSSQTVFHIHEQENI